MVLTVRRTIARCTRACSNVYTSVENDNFISTHTLRTLPQWTTNTLPATQQFDSWQWHSPSHFQHSNRWQWHFLSTQWTASLNLSSMYSSIHLLSHRMQISQRNEWEVSAVLPSLSHKHHHDPANSRTHTQTQFNFNFDLNFNSKQN